jgi:hypothetical protein
MIEGPVKRGDRFLIPIEVITDEDGYGRANICLPNGTRSFQNVADFLPVQPTAEHKQMTAAPETKAAKK